MHGINLNFAPFLDLHDYSKGGLRRFGNDPRVIGQHGRAFMAGLLSTGVGACAKHFPDGNDAEYGNPHEQLIEVPYSPESLQYQARYGPLIDAGLPAIMMSHVAFSAVDGQPASLSKKWITEILRGELGFDGVVITDALGMDAIEENIPMEAAVIRSINAGADLILGDASHVRKILNKAVSSGEITSERINEAAARVLTLSKSYPLTANPVNPAPRERLLEKIQQFYHQVQAKIRSAR